MKINPLVAVLLPISSHVVSAHWTFTRFLVNGTVSKDWQYIRKISRTITPYYIPDKEDLNVRCNFDAHNNGAGVETATVLAGQSVGFGTESFGFPQSQGLGLYHPGPAQAYLSKVPSGDFAAYKGDGDWFKIGEYTYADKSNWVINGYRFPNPIVFMNFTIPKSTPPGKYLMRGEHMFHRYPGFNGTQFYISCAHIDIVGPGGGVPGPLVRFPGAYDPNEPSIAVPDEKAIEPRKGSMDLTGYKNPGPDIWRG